MDHTLLDNVYVQRLETWTVSECKKTWKPFYCGRFLISWFFRMITLQCNMRTLKKTTSLWLFEVFHWFHRYFVCSKIVRENDLPVAIERAKEKKKLQGNMSLRVVTKKHYKFVGKIIFGAVFSFFFEVLTSFSCSLVGVCTMKTFLEIDGQFSSQDWFSLFFFHVSQNWKLLFSKIFGQ